MSPIFRIRVAPDKYCQCNNCLAINFESSGFLGCERVDTIYEVNFPDYAAFLCRDCLESLNNSINKILKGGK